MSTCNKISVYFQVSYLVLSLKYKKLIAVAYFGVPGIFLNVNAVKFPHWINGFCGAASCLQNSCHAEASGYVLWTIPEFRGEEGTKKNRIKMLVSYPWPSLSLKDISPPWNVITWRLTKKSSNFKIQNKTPDEKHQYYTQCSYTDHIRNNEKENSKKQNKF